MNKDIKQLVSEVNKNVDATKNYKNIKNKISFSSDGFLKTYKRNSFIKKVALTTTIFGVGLTSLYVGLNNSFAYTQSIETFLTRNYEKHTNSAIISFADKNYVLKFYIGENDTKKDLIVFGNYSQSVNANVTLDKVYEIKSNENTIINLSSDEINMKVNIHNGQKTIINSTYYLNLSDLFY